MCVQGSLNAFVFVERWKGTVFQLNRVVCLNSEVVGSSSPLKSVIVQTEPGPIIRPLKKFKEANHETNNPNDKLGIIFFMCTNGARKAEEREHLDEFHLCDR